MKNFMNKGLSINECLGVAKDGQRSREKEMI